MPTNLKMCLLGSRTTTMNKKKKGIARKKTKYRGKNVKNVPSRNINDRGFKLPGFQLVRI